MADHKKEVQVGVVFMLAVAVLISGVLWFKEFRIGGKSYLITVEFENTSGLQKGDPIEVRGVTSGQVAAITFREGRALVSLRLDNAVVIYPETEFVIENVGIMGQKMLAVYPGPEGPPEPLDKVFRGSYQSGIPALMADLGSALDSFDRLARRLESLLAAFDETDEGTFTNILENTERLTEELADFLSATRGNLAEMVSNFNLAMSDLHDVLDGRNKDFGAALENANRAASRLDSTLVEVQEAVGRADRLLTGVERGEGTLGRLAQDPELYDELRETLAETKALLRDVQENPRKYLKFSVF
jgi:phospholipid/cholesterol/gamma-HCH transport system substrate-binding protein